MNEQIKISVVVPTFNSQMFVGYALMSIIEQVDEIVVVDMMSTDNTLKIIEAISDSKIQVFALKDLVMHKKECNLDSSIEYGLKLASGNVIMRTDDDWIWGSEIRNLRHYCMQGLQKGKRGLRGNVYNLITTHEYFLPLWECYIAIFKQSNDPLMHFGSYRTDNSIICHKSEIKRSSNRKFTLFKRSRYLGTPIGLGHWKFLKDTKEQFLYKWKLFTGCSEKEALEWWEHYHKQSTLDCPYNFLQPLYEYRNKFVPLGGFDITKGR